MPADLAILIACLAFGILALRNVLWGAALVFFLLPTYQFRIEVGMVPLTLLEVFLLILIGLWIVRRVRKGGRPLASLPWLWTILLLLVSAVVAVFVAPDRVSALGYFKAYFLEPILFFIVLWDMVATRRAVRLLVLALGAGVLLLSIVALLQYLSVLPAPEPWVSETPRRVTSLFDFPNAVGLFFAPILALFLGLALFPASIESRTERVFVWSVLLLGTLALLAAVSRGALLGLAFGALFVSTASRFRRWAILGLACAIILALLLPGTRTTIFRVATGTDVSTDVRLVLWQGTARLLLDRPVVGAGLGGFPAVYDAYRLAKHTELPLYPHNIVLNAWVELGLAGLLLFSWLLLDAFRRGFRLLRHPALTPFARSLIVGTLAALITMIVHGIVDVPYFKNDLAVQFWFLLALLPIAGRLAPTGQKD